MIDWDFDHTSLVRDLANVRPEIGDATSEKTAAIIADQMTYPKDRITRQSRLIEDLGMS